MTLWAVRARRAGLSRPRRRRRNPSRPGSSGSCRSGGKGARVGDGLAGDPQRGDEADPVRVVPAVVGCLDHEGADREVAAQVSPDLLADQVGGLRAQHRAWSALVGLELVEGQLDLPPLGVGRGEVDSADLGRVQHRGEQPVAGGVLAPVVDYTIDDGRENSTGYRLFTTMLD